MLNGLGLLAPAFLAAAAAIAVPVVLHLFRRRTDTVVAFAAMRLLRRDAVEQQRMRQPRDWRLLLLRIAALLLLAVGFARPYWSGAAAAGAPLTVIAVDTSLSLSAPGQFEAARRAALAAIDATPPASLVALLAFDDSARVVVAPTDRRQVVRDALARLDAGAGGTRYARMLAEAAALFGAAGGDVVVVTDLQAQGWDGGGDRRLPAGVGLRVEGVPSPLGNLAVTGATMVADVVTALVWNGSDGPRDTEVRLLEGGRALASTTVTVRPRTTVDVPLQAGVPAGRRVEVRITDAEGYRGDNVRYLPVEPDVPLAVLLVTPSPVGEAPAVQHALEAGGPGGRLAVTRVAAAEVGALSDAAVQRHAAVVVLGTRALDRTGRQRLATALAAGAGVWVAAGPDLDVPALSAVLGTDAALATTPVDGPGRAALVPVDPRHPLFRVFGPTSGALADLDITRLLPLAPETPWQVLARFSGGAPALAERRIGAGRLLVVTTDLDGHWNRWPVRPGFVPFVREAVLALAGHGVGAAETTVADRPEGVPAVPGHHAVTRGDTARVVAVNPDPRESDMEADSREAFVQAARRDGGRPAVPPVQQAVADEAQRPLWPMALACVLLALGTESLLGRAARPAVRG